MRPALRSLFAFVTALVVASSIAQAAERSIDKEIVLMATPEQAWQAWTTREGITSFFAPDARIEPRAGGAFEVYINPYAEPGMKGADDMRFLALQHLERATAPARGAAATHRRRRPHPSGQRTRDAHHAASHRLGRRRRVGSGVRLLRSRLGQRARQPEEALRDRPDRLDRVARADAQDHAEEVTRSAVGRRG
jgi:Activator of Hsp90 ATPase homolog 1-like protein